MPREKLIQARLRAGVSQQQVAELCLISQPSISRIESGTNDPSAGTLVRLCEIFDLSPRDVLDRGTEPRRRVAKHAVRIPVVPEAAKAALTTTEATTNG